ncbi:conjugal transfer protein TraG N-terminal domain-containing protein [Termitidicoccus mucosus]|uniref:Uncharacterized protein n=1 Tax=Termitidicoccus mucosus TaxID=1184151 RepID=A0A178ILL0_9BACT|nr:hypothetical protein AW736_09495 [Opitutaceae bacterium TSB47]
MNLALPLLENKFQTLIVAFRFVVFAMMVVGLIVQMSRAQYHHADFIRPVARALTITALVASMGWWFPLVENTLLATADYINPEYSENPSRAADRIREAARPDSEGREWSWRKLNESIYHAFTDALSWMFIQISTLLTAPMILLQYILRWILYLLTPFALGCFMIPVLSGMAVRFFQQVLAILSWPVGFAITNLLAVTIWQDFRAVVGANPASPEMIAYAPFLNNAGCVLAGLTLLIGTVSTPVVCQMLFAHGHAFTGQTASPVAIGRAASEITTRAGAAARMFTVPAPSAGASAPPPARFTPGL